MALITINELSCNTAGTLPMVGTTAPNFILTKNDMADIHLKNYLGRNILLNIFPHLTQDLLKTELPEMQQLVENDKNSLLLCVSRDLPYTQKNMWASEVEDNIILVSSFRDPDFGRVYGVLITDGPEVGLLARAIIQIDPHGIISRSSFIKDSPATYRQIGHEPTK